MTWIEYKYTNLLANYLERFDQVNLNPPVWTFRCPYCGDSKKNKNKRRGYIYQKEINFSYYCHNCGMARSFEFFLKDVSPSLWKEYKIEKFGRQQAPSQDVNSVLRKKPDFSRGGKKDEWLGTPLCECDADSTVLCYAKGRKIPEKFYNSLYSCEDINLIANQIEKYKGRKFPSLPSLVIPFYDKERKFSYIQCRLLTEDKKSRFTTFQINDILPRLWGLELICWKLPVYVFEGPIDAMCVCNSVALGGATADIDFSKWGKDRSEIIYVFDNERKNKQIIHQMDRKIAEGFSIAVYDSQFHWKDVNEAIMWGMNYGQLKNYIEKRTFSGLKAKLELTEFVKCKT